MINKIEDDEEKAKFTNDFTNWWKTGKPIQ